MKNRKCVVAIIFVLMAFAVVPAMGQKVPQSSKQLQFSAEDEGVKRPVKIPEEVLAILRKDKLVHNILADQELTTEKLPSAWFSAAECRLGSSGQKDLIVTAVGPLVGANINPFWVFIRDRDGFELVLTVFVHDLWVGKTRSHGYRDLKTFGMTASTITTVKFRFDGDQYKEYAAKTEDIK